jgi:hypothetical protein
MHRRVERQAIRMHEMLDRLDVDPVALVRLQNGDAYAGARSLCLFCGASDKCLRWLDGYGRQDRISVPTCEFSKPAREVRPISLRPGRAAPSLLLKHLEEIDWNGKHDR